MVGHHNYAQITPISQKELYFISHAYSLQRIQKEFQSIIFKGNIPLNACALCTSITKLSSRGSAPTALRPPSNATLF